MSRRRETADGLPYRVYERFGVVRYSIGYKLPDGRWAFRLHCDVNDKAAINRHRRDAMIRAASITDVVPADGSVAALLDNWFEFQNGLPPGSARKRAATTLAENARELKRLRVVFGHMAVQRLEKRDAYGYQDACEREGRAAKGNKEISLFRAVLEYGVRKGLISSNPFDGVRSVRTQTTSRLVTGRELMLALRVGRELGGPQHIVALALVTAYLCVRRSVEVRAMRRDQITGKGIEWTAAKQQAGQPAVRGLILWSPRLRQTIDEALAIRRNAGIESEFVFGNLRGGQYTKGGWKATLAVLMDACSKRATTRPGGPRDFRPFSLQDCRPMGVSAKLDKKAEDVRDATLHSSERMINQVYDRRKVRVATPTS